MEGCQCFYEAGLQARRGKFSPPASEQSRQTLSGMICTLPVEVPGVGLP